MALSGDRVVTMGSRSSSHGLALPRKWQKRFEVFKRLVLDRNYLRFWWLKNYSAPHLESQKTTVLRRSSFLEHMKTTVLMPSSFLEHMKTTVLMPSSFLEHMKTHGFDA